MERRKTIRIFSEMVIKLRSIDEHGNSMFAGTGTVKDWSISGVSFLADKELQPNTDVAIEFHIREIELKIRGRVVRVMRRGRKYEIGVKLAVDEDSTLKALENLVFLE